MKTALLYNLFGMHEIGKKWQRGKRNRGEAANFTHLVGEKYRGEN